MPTIQLYLHAAYLWLAAINPLLPWAAIVLVPCWIVPLLMRRFFPHTWELLPGIVDRVLLDFGLPVDLWGSGALRVIVQGLPALALGAVAAALAVHADPKHAFWGVIAGAFAPALHAGIKRLSVKYSWLVPLLGSFPAAGTATPGGGPKAPLGGSGTALVLLCAGLSLGHTGCAAFQSAKPIIHSVNDAAQALCAAYEAAKLGQPADSGAVTQFCSIEGNWAPFIATVTAKQQDGRVGVPLRTAALPEGCVRAADPPPDGGASDADGDAGAGAPVQSFKAIRPKVSP